MHPTSTVKILLLFTYYSLYSHVQSVLLLSVAFCSILSLSEQFFLQLQLFTENILSCGVNLWNSLSVEIK